MKPWYELSGIDAVRESEAFEKRLAKLANAPRPKKRKREAQLAQMEKDLSMHDSDNRYFEKVRRFHETYCE